MKILARLSREDKIVVKIPNLVVREYISKKAISSKEDISHIAHKLKSLKRTLGQEHDVFTDISALELKLKELHQSIDAPLNSNFNHWVKDNKIIILDFNPEDISVVFDEYFSGGGAFRKAKHRDDIPDAMIEKAIQKEVKDGEEVIVILKDGQFKEYLDSCENISTIHGIDEFLELKSIIDINDELEAKSKKIEQIKVLLTDTDVQNKLREFISSENSYIESIYLQDEDIIDNDNIIGMDYFGAVIESLDVSSIDNVKFLDPKFIDDDLYSIDFEFDALSAISYCASYGEYMALPEERHNKIDIDSMNGNGICDLSELRTFTYHGAVEIYLHEQTKPERLLVHIQYLGPENKVVSATVDIKSADVKFINRGV